MQTERPTKKQRELLTFIDNFIAGHGYGPSYREIMSGLGYKSVATVALHVDGLITKGHLRKKTRSARSLEVVDSAKAEFKTPKVKEGQEKWLVEQIEQRFKALESAPQVSKSALDELYVLTGALKVLGFASAAETYTGRIAQLKKQL